MFIMSSKRFTLLGCAALAFSCGTLALRAEDAPAADGAAAEENKVDEALEFEISYAEALIDAAFPDIAEKVIAETKAKWPESEARFFAIEIRGMLSLNKFDEAEKKIAALPDRKSTKYWAARLEIANNYFGRGKKKECMAIYEEFFKVFPKPPKDIRQFYLQSSYTLGQLLMTDKRFAEAAQRYEAFLKMLDKKKSDDDANLWCNVACETSDIYLRLASEKATPAERKSLLDSAKKLVDQLLWEQDKPVYFGRAIAMKANIELLKGDIQRAQGVIDDYMDQLRELHDTLKKYDPDGRNGLLKLSPMPLCRYMLAKMYWDEAQAEFKKPKRDDEKIKSLMFGDKLKNGKRNNAGAYNHALNVFINYPESSWAAKAGPLSDEIENFAIEKYGAKIQKKVTPEQQRKVREMQFRSGFEAMAENQWAQAITNYFQALAVYPEGADSVQAIENIVTCYQNMILRSKDQALKDEWRMDADAVSGYLAERFCEYPDRAVMTAAGDAVIRIAAAEKSHNDLARADQLYRAFFTNFRGHANASIMAQSMASEAQQAEKWEDAIGIWSIITNSYKKTTAYPIALQNLSVCYDRIGDRANSIESMKKYIAIEENALKKTQMQMNLAQAYKQDGFDILAAAETNATAEAVAAQEAEGSNQIIRGIKEFNGFEKIANEQLASPAVTPGDKKRYTELKEVAMYLVGDSWGRLNKPADKQQKFRELAVQSFEKYVAEYPQGKYAKYAYVKLGTMYTVLNNMEKAKDSLNRLAESFPDSDEAKNSKPRLAKTLVDMGFKKEGSEVYAEMLKTDGAYNAWQFINAGDALIEARSWELANQAYEKAKAKAATNQFSVVAKANIGLAKALYKQKDLVAARDALDAFMADDKQSRLSVADEAFLLMADVASEQGEKEKDDKVRNKDFNVALGALQRLRGSWQRALDASQKAAEAPAEGEEAGETKTAAKAKKLHTQDEIDALNILSADITIRRMNAELAMGMEDKAMATCKKAATQLMIFEQTHSVSEERPLDKMTAAQLKNLEDCYTRMVPLYARIGAEGGEFVLTYGNRYLELFPNGKARTEIMNAINQAKAGGAVMTGETPKAVAPAAEPAEDGAEAAPAAEAAEPAAEAAEPAAEATAAEGAAE